MPGRAGFRMLLWISAAGLAGAGWFGWLVWRDYDWTAFGWSQIRSSANERTMPSPNAHSSNYGRESHSDELTEQDLLGHTYTQWNNELSELTSLSGQSKKETDSQNDTTVVNGSDNTLPDQTTIRHKPADEDFVVVEPSLSAVAGTKNLESDHHHATDEDFVVVGPTGSAAGVSPFLSTTDEDFVVVGNPGDGDESEELPEVDLTDYVNNWTPIVPKIAALISHELWPQLRSYLESLPQFGDTNLERVVNAVAEDIGVTSATADGVGEGEAECPLRRTGPTEGFAFYASLFDEMAHESELAEV